MKVLIIRFSSIGDIILTSPIARCLKQQIAGVEVHYVTKKSFKNLLDNDPNIDKIHLLEENLSSLIYDLKQENFNFLIDLHKNIRTLKIKMELGVKCYSFNKINMQKWLLVNLKLNVMPNVHIVDRYFKAVKPLGVVNDHLGLSFYFPNNFQFDLGQYSLISDRYVVFAIGGQHATKKMPVKKIVELCMHLNEKIVIIGGKEDMASGSEIVESLVGIDNVINLCGLLTINQSAFIIKESKYLISHDTGMMHIGAAFKKKIYAIWGNTVPELGMYPYQTEHVNVQNAELSCRPCSKIGFDRCPKGHFKCMNDINFVNYFN